MPTETHTPYDALPEYAREFFEERAQLQIYPDLRRAYAAHKEMIQLLGRTLYELERLAKQVFAIDRRKSIKDDFQSIARFHR
jgi:hypothetical protein